MDLVDMETLNQNYYPQKRVFCYHLIIKRYVTIAINQLTLKIIIPAVLG
jgi:hypothetical protein